MFHLVEKLKNKTIQEKRWSPLKRNSLYATIVTFSNKTSFFSGLSSDFSLYRKIDRRDSLYSSIFNLQLVRKVDHFPCDNPAKGYIEQAAWQVFFDAKFKFKHDYNCHKITGSCHGLCSAFDMQKKKRIECF